MKPPLQMLLVAATIGLLIATLLSWSADHHYVHVTVQTPDGSGSLIEVAALPFDPDRILDSLERAYPVPRPDYDSLIARMLAFRPGDAGALDSASVEWRATRDSVIQLSRELRAMNPAATGYRVRYASFREMYSRLMTRSGERERVYRELLGEDRDLAVRARGAADTLRAWEDSAFAAYDSLVQTRLTGMDRAPRDGITDEQGELVLDLAPGKWWLIAVMRQPDNPFMEYYWNEPLRVWAPVGRMRIELNRRNAVLRWRH